MLKISVVLAFRNEQANLSDLERRFSDSLKRIAGTESELIFVDDASTDDSESVVSQLDLEHTVTYLKLSRRFGVANSIIAGFEVASGDAIVVMDCDLQDPPELLGDMFEQFQRGFDVVHMRRTKRLGESRLKLGLTYLAYRLLAQLSEVQLPVDTGDFKLYSRRAVDQILEVVDADPYLRGFPAIIGFPQTSIEYIRNPRFQGKSHFSIFKSGPTKEFIRGITSFSAIPLYVSLWFGLAALGVAFCVALYAVWAKLTENAVPGSTGVLLVVTFFAAAQLISQGLIGLYVSKIFRQVRPLPRYIVQDKCSKHKSKS